MEDKAPPEDFASLIIMRERGVYSLGRKDFSDGSKREMIEKARINTIAEATMVMTIFFRFHSTETRSIRDISSLSLVSS